MDIESIPDLPSTTPADTPGALMKLEFSYLEIHDHSVKVLTGMEESKMTIPTAVLTLGLSLGRLLAPGRMEDAQEIKFLQDLIDWAGMYFAAGRAN